MTDWLAVLAGVLLTAGTAVFVAAEFSLVSLDRPQVQQAVDRGDRGAVGVLRSLRSLSTQLSGTQVGITMTTLVLGFVTTPALTSLLTGPLQRLGLEGTTGVNVAAVLALALATLFSMIFGELVPQFLGFSAPMRTARVVVGPLRVFTTLMRPLIALFNGSANLVLRAVGVEPQEELSAARSPQELAAMVRSSAEAGTLTENTARLLTASITFGDQTAADVMTPRSRCEGLERTASAADVLVLARRTGHSRFPVLDEDWDDIVGVVHVKQAVAVPFERRPDVPVTALMTDPVLVPETVRLDPLLGQLREAGYQLAVVMDEYGGTSGVVTLEDVVEEIVGEVADEHDRSETTGRRLPDGSWTVPGLWRPDEVRSRIGVSLPEHTAYETVGGWVMQQLGRIPAVGDEVRVDGWVVTVLDMEGRRVDRLRFVCAPTEDAEGAS